MTEDSILSFNAILGREIRGGSYADQGIATYSKIVAAIDSRRAREAVALARYFLVEAGVCYEVFGGWRARLFEYLTMSGVDSAELEDVNQRIAAIVSLPDGRPFVRGDEWERLGERVDALVEAIDDVADTRSIQLVDEVFEIWRRAHDRDVDWICGLMDEIVKRLGEQSIGEMYEHMLVQWFGERYSRFDVDSHAWPEALALNVQVALESMRAHLCGPSRRGDVAVRDLHDRIVLEFAPCGTGGRTVVGDAIEGTAPRMEPPYSWAVTREPASWNHFEPGVCVYCAHCIVLTEQMPIDAFGYPVRAVDPPRYRGTGSSDNRCTWTMFKDPKNIPASYYTRVGRVKPADIGSKAVRGATVPRLGTQEIGPTDSPNEPS